MTVNLFDLSGKVALVTGANSGLGLAYARGLAKAGASVVIWGRREDKNQQAVQELEQYGGKVLADVVDVGSEQAVAAGIEKVVSQLGRLDCAVVNAGFATRTESILDLSSEMYHDLLNVNLHGAFYTLREAARAMVNRAEAGEPGGSLIVCGSLSIINGVAGMSHYAAAKGALNSMVKTLAVEMGPHQIRANVVLPGFIATEMTQADPEAYKVMDEAVSQATPVRRVGRPEDFEAIAVYLASDSSAFHTGDSIVIDGGRSIS